MTRKYDTATLTRIADVALAGPAPREAIDRTFGLPTGLYAVTVGTYLAFLAIMAFGFQSRDMILPMAIFVIYIGMAFGVPMMWARMTPGNPSRALSWSQFEQHGIETWTGRISAKDAMLQVLILPVLILLWGVVVVAIAAAV